jgi:branched-chain amino acid transport system ATP-binding protein
VTVLLEVADLHAGYGRAEVLHGISLTVDEGEIATLIGPNGAGKTTTLHAIMRLIASRGSVRFQGADIARASTEELVARGMALVPETRALFTDMSVEENLLLGFYRSWRQGKRDQDAMLAEIFAIFPRLQERRKQRAGTLSGGERQMLALGRALMGRPKLLLLDEPSLGLAPLIVRDIFAVLDRLRGDGLSILLVEQNARAALALADHGMVLEMGAVVATGRSADLAVDPRVLETYLGARHA